MRKRIALLASIILAAQLSGCTSKDSQNESEMGDDVVAESSEGTDGELEQIDAPAEEGAVASGDGANEGFLDDQLPEDALGESTNTAAAEPSLDAGSPPAEVAENATPPPGEPSMDPMAADAPPPSNDLALDEALGSVDTGTTPPADEPPPAPLADTPSTDTSTVGSIGDMPPPVSDSTSTLTETTSTTSEAAPAPIAEAKPKASLKKVEDAPFKRKGTLLNAVYVARPGDNYKKISAMIYGDESKAKELAKVNPSLGKKPKPGDKVYYNSPARSADDTKLLTFYEDSGMMPELYVAKEGDNLKKVAKELLGYDNAWKEIWATNSVDSKGDLTAGTELRYWKSAPAAPMAPPSSEVAQANAAPPVDPAAAPMPDMPPPPPAEMAPPVAMNDVPPPPAEMAPPPADLPPPVADLPPPPPAEAMNPPPPPPMPKKTAGMEDAGMDQDMMMSLAGAGIIAAGLAMVIIIRKRRQDRDRMNNAFSDTQVGT